MLYKKIKNYLSNVSSSPKFLTFTKCFTSAFLAASVAATTTYFCVKSEEEKTKEIPETEGSYVSKEIMDRIYDSCFQIKNSQTLEEKIENSDLKISHGSGVLLVDSQTKDKYILSVQHLISDFVETKAGHKIKVLSHMLIVGDYGASVIKKDEKADLSLLKVHNSLEPPHQGKISKELSLGNYVLGIGFSGNNKQYFIAQLKEEREHDILFSVQAKKGNSGGGVFRLKNGVIELAGVVRGYIEHKPLGTISPLEQLQDFIKGTPLEDDYLQ